MYGEGNKSCDRKVAVKERWKNISLNCGKRCYSIKHKKEAIKPILIKARISPTKLKEPGKLRLASKKNKNKPRKIDLEDFGIVREEGFNWV